MIGVTVPGTPQVMYSSSPYTLPGASSVSAMPMTSYTTSMPMAFSVLKHFSVFYWERVCWLHVAQFRLFWVPWDILKCSLFTSTLAWNFWPRNLSFRGARNDPVVVIWPLVGSSCMVRQFGSFSGQMVRSWWSLATWFYGYHPSGGTHSTARGSLDDGQGVVIQWKFSMMSGLNSRFKTFVSWILYISFGVWWKFVKRVVLAQCFQWQARESFVVTGTKVGSAMPITKTKVSSKLSFCAMGLSSQIWLLCMFPSTCLTCLFLMPCHALAHLPEQEV